MSPTHLVALVLAVAACKKVPPPGADTRSISELARLEREMCQCTDSVCASDVESKLKAWQGDRETRGSSTRFDEKATSAAIAKIEARYKACLTKVASVPPAPGAAIEHRRRTTTWQVDALVREALAWTRMKDPAWRVANMRFEYVDRTGALDPEYGTLSIAAGRLVTEKRRVGAPSRSIDYVCRALTLERGAWVVRNEPCADANDYVPSCSVTNIWNRALERHPTLDPDAVAVISFVSSTKNWIFEINDEPTKLHVREELPDTCELTVETPAPPRPGADQR